MNRVNVSYAVFGNHEFDSSKVATLNTRLAQSTFQWLTGNVFVPSTNYTRFASSRTLPYKLFTINGVRILLLAFTISSTQPNYVYIAPLSYCITYSKSLVSSLSGQYDVVFALTHWDLNMDIELIQSVPQIQAVFGGHEHQNMKVFRGPNSMISNWTGTGGVFKADSNDQSVYVHRCAWNPITKQLVMNSELVMIDATIPSDPNVTSWVNYWQDLGMKSFISQGFNPTEVITTLTDPWDGTSATVRARSDSLTRTLSNAIAWYGNCSYSWWNAGAIRIDDTLIGPVTQYDFLRIWPFNNDLSLRQFVPAADALAFLNYGTSLVGNGFFMQYSGFFQNSTGWFDINGNSLATSNENYLVCTIDFYAATYSPWGNPVPAPSLQFLKNAVTDTTLPAVNIQMPMIHYIQQFGSAA